MKVVERVMEVDSNLEGEKIDLTIDDDAVQHIMSVLTDLYSDPEYAVIREYSTNAFDAHVEANVKRAIEVTLPAPLSPFFKIRDYGEGMDVEDIRNIYSRYGTSTKRNSNDVVGMLGLGCKSALTYCDQFTVTAVKDGVMTQVAISRDANGAGSMTIVSQAPTTEPSGVEIVVPAKRQNEFASKAQYFYQFWQPGTVLVNGTEPTPIDGLWVEQGKYLMTESAKEPTVVMGNVPYPMTNPDSGETYSNGRRYDDRRGWIHVHLVAFVDIGEVAFTPSRESLNWNGLTKTTIKRVRQECQDKLDASFLAQIAAAKTPADAIAMYRKAVSSGLSDKGQKDAKFEGQDVITKFERMNADGSAIKHGMMSSDNSYLFVNWTGYRHSGRKKGERTTSVKFEDVEVWFTNFAGVELSPYKREKLEVFLSQKKMGREHKNSDGTTKAPHAIVCIKNLTKTEKFWIKGAKVFDWADVDAIKLKKDTVLTRDDGRPKGSYDGRKDGAWVNFQAGDIDTTKLLLWQTSRGSSRGVNEWVPEDATIVRLGLNRIVKFKRDFPMARKVDDYCHEQLSKWVKNMDRDLILAYKVQQNSGRVVRDLNPDRVDDPRLKRAIALSRKSTSTLTERIRTAQYYDYEQHSLMMSEIAKVKVDFHPDQAYPLLDGFSYGFKAGKQTEHIYLYLNAAYKAQQEREAAASQEGGI